MKTFNIKPVSQKVKEQLQHKIDFKTKPLGALGDLEKIALQIGLIQNSPSPVLNNPTILVFAGDHGITQEGVSAYPQEVTFQMVMNFIQGGAAINVFCKQNGLNIKIIDAGVNYEFPDSIEGLIRQKIAHGTRNMLLEPAMSVEQTEQAIELGARIVKETFENGCNIIGFGEMGIGNTTSASALMSYACKYPVADCVGKGTGLDSAGITNKIAVLERVMGKHSEVDSPLQALVTFGGFEIAQMVGGMLQAAELGMIILVDGFITTSAFLVAAEIAPQINDYALFCHQSGEQGHRKMLDYLQVKPLLHLNMRLGEGTGAAVVYPIIKAAVSFLNEMASFESAGVSNKEENQIA